MLLDRQPITFDRFVRLVITVSFFCGLVWLAGYLSDVLIPFAAAVVLAYMINPLVTWIQRGVRSRVLAVLLALAVLIGLAFAAGVLAVPRVSAEVTRMGRLVADLAENADLQARAARLLPEEIWESIRSFAADPDVRSLFEEDKSREMIEAGVRRVLPGVWGLLTGTASLIMSIVGLAVIILYLVFLLVDYERFRRGWREMIPPAYREKVTVFVADFESAMRGYFRGQALVALLCGILFAAGFCIVGLPLAVLLGLFIGLLNMVPYLQAIGVIPAAMLSVVQALDTGTSVWLVLAETAVVFLVVQAIQDFILTPRIMGKVTGLSPAMILLSLSIWGKLLGLLGLIVALPLSFLLLAYYRRFLRAEEVAQAAGPAGAAADKKP